MFTNKDSTRFENVETPCYYYDLPFLRKTLDSCMQAASSQHFHIHYALKANFNEKILEAIRVAGIGADCVSIGEVKRALEYGFPRQSIVFAGVGKSDSEIRQALEEDIFCFNVESIQELEVIDQLAAARNKIAKVAVRINPNVDAHTHQNITTGLDENKFGINAWDLPTCIDTLKKAKNLDFVGIHFHIGSQITNLDVYKNLCVRVNEFSALFEDKGLQVKVLNVGGGLGIDYHHPDHQIPDFQGYFKIFKDFLTVKSHQEVHFELGRALVGQCAALLSRVLYVKNGKKKNFIVLDAGMTELMRPALYQAYHKIENLSKMDESPQLRYDVVGPICESTDCFGKELLLPLSFRGDIFAIRSAGAYAEVMASKYNLREDIRRFFKEELED